MCYSLRGALRTYYWGLYGATQADTTETQQVIIPTDASPISSWPAQAGQCFDRNTYTHGGATGSDESEGLGLVHTGDITTLPESETSDLRSLTSGKVLGRVKIISRDGGLFH